MEDLKIFAEELASHTDDIMKNLNYKLQNLYHPGKSRAGSTPYASKRKKKRK